MAKRARGVRGLDTARERGSQYYDNPGGIAEPDSTGSLSNSCWVRPRPADPNGATVRASARAGAITFRVPECQLIRFFPCPLPNPTTPGALPIGRFTHKSFETNPVVRFVLAGLESMAVEGSVLKWVALHRRHHQHSDTISYYVIRLLALFRMAWKVRLPA